MSRQFCDIEVQWRKSIIYLTNLHPRTHNEFIPHVVGSPSIRSTIYSRIICFAKKGLNHSNTLINFFFRNCVVNMYSYMSRNINIILRKLNISFNEMITRPESWLKSRCSAMSAPDWRARLVCELIQCREGSMQCDLDADQIKEMLTFLCTS